MNIFRCHSIENFIGIYIIKKISHLNTMKIQLQHGKFLHSLIVIFQLRIINHGPEHCDQWYLVFTYLEQCSSKEEWNTFFKYVYL